MAEAKTPSLQPHQARKTKFLSIRTVCKPSKIITVWFKKPSGVSLMASCLTTFVILAVREALLLPAASLTSGFMGLPLSKHCSSEP